MRNTDLTSKKYQNTVWGGKSEFLFSFGVEKSEFIFLFYKFDIYIVTKDFLSRDVKMINSIHFHFCSASEIKISDTS